MVRGTEAERHSMTFQVFRHLTKYVITSDLVPNNLAKKDVHLLDGIKRGVAVLTKKALQIVMAVFDVLECVVKRVRNHLVIAKTTAFHY